MRRLQEILLSSSQISDSGYHFIEGDPEDEGGDQFDHGFLLPMMALGPP